MINQLLSLTELSIRSLIRVMLRETILRLIYSNSNDERQKNVNVVLFYLSRFILNYSVC